MPFHQRAGLKISLLMETDTRHWIMKMLRRDLAGSAITSPLLLMASWTFHLLEGCGFWVWKVLWKHTLQKAAPVCKFWANLFSSLFSLLVIFLMKQATGKRRALFLFNIVLGSSCTNLIGLNIRAHTSNFYSHERACFRGDFFSRVKVESELTF